MQTLSALDGLIIFGPFLVSALALGIAIHLHGSGGH
jgi:hypothetical protein